MWLERSFHQDMDRLPLFPLEEVEKRLSQLEKKFEEKESETDKQGRKSEYLFKGAGLIKDLFILIDKARDFIQS